MMYVFVIKQVRKNKGVSVNQLSKKTHLSPAYIKDLEGNRKYNPTMKTLGIIADALSVNVKDLFYTKLDIDELKEELDARIEMHGIHSPEVLEVSRVIDLLMNLIFKPRESNK